MKTRSGEVCNLHTEGGTSRYQSRICLNATRTMRIDRLTYYDSVRIDLMMMVGCFYYWSTESSQYRHFSY